MEATILDSGSRLEFKRVDEIWEESQWILRDSAETVHKKDQDDKYREYSFIIVRRYHATTFTLVNTLIEIKSDHLRKALQDVIKQVNGVSWNARPLRVDPQLFLAFLPQLDQHVTLTESKLDKSEDDQKVADHLKLLLDFLKSEHSATLAEIANLTAHGEITYDLLWAILVPRTILFAHCPVTNEPRAFRLVHAEQRIPYQMSPFWRLDCEYIEATGKRTPSAPRFGFSDTTIDIPMFKGTTKIATLSAYPFKWHPRADDMRQRLIARGKRWMSLCGVHHRYYNAVAFIFRNCRYVKVTVNSRIMIDVASFKLINPNYSLPSVKGTDDGNNNDDYGYYGNDSEEDEDDSDTKSEERFALFHTLGDEQLLLASSILYGFSLGDKLWVEFSVDHVKTFEWNDEAFERLVLPPSQKDLIQSLVESHKADQGFDDFIEGKGRGLIINLFGPPGVGKTLSAEATSEHVRRPLYVVGAGDLGTHASVLDQTLNEIFQVASAWGAIVLIDEADVFLEQRSLHDLERNAMVAVFLRQLEYYRGILFMTTNRVKTFDEAFQSRIHVALRYRDLDKSAKRQIWSSFLQKVGFKPAAEQLDCLSEKKLNGRQIKNAVRTADAVASSKKQPLGFAHLQQALEVMEQFEEDFKEIQQ